MEERREARKAPRAANLMDTVTNTKDPMGTKAKGYPILLRLRRARTYRSELPIEVDQQHRRRTKARRGKVSLKEKRQKNS